MAKSIFFLKHCCLKDGSLLNFSKCVNRVVLAELRMLSYNRDHRLFSRQ